MTLQRAPSRAPPICVPFVPARVRSSSLHSHPVIGRPPAERLQHESHVRRHIRLAVVKSWSEARQSDMYRRSNAEEVSFSGLTCADQSAVSADQSTRRGAIPENRDNTKSFVYG